MYNKLNHQSRALDLTRGMRHATLFVGRPQSISQKYSQYHILMMSLSGESSDGGTSKGDIAATGLLRSALQGTQKPSTSNLGILALTNFLKTSLSITRDPEIRRILDIMTNKNSLYGTKKGRQPVNPYARNVTVQEATAVTEYLATFGFTKDEIRQLVIAFPQILCYSVEERIQDLLEYLVDSVGIPQERLRTILLQRPTVFGLQKKQLEQMLGFLLNNGSSQDEIIRLLQTSL